MSEHPTLGFNEVDVGQSLPPLVIDISTGLVVGGALATRDFEKVHHDKAVARSTGLPDVFMNILTSQGLMTRFVTDWSGPEAVIKSMDVRLGAPNVPGMVMTIRGEVIAKHEGNRVDVAVTGENDIWGMHMQGTVQIVLPEEQTW